MSISVYQLVTDRIIAELEKGNIPWNKPWTGIRSGAFSRSTGKPYSVLNQMLLMKPGEYLTYKQAQAAGGTIKKGEKSQIVGNRSIIPRYRKSWFPALTPLRTTTSFLLTKGADHPSQSPCSAPRAQALY